MPSFTFMARDANGKSQNGMQNAATASEVVSQLRGRGWIVLQVESAFNQGPSLARSLNPAHWLPATGFDLEMGLLQIATMLRSGLTLLAAIRTAGEQVRRPAMGDFWRRVYARIEEGSSFASALSADQLKFPEFVVQLVAVGEQSGQLETVMTRAAQQLERSREMRVRLFNALMYPCIVLFM